MAARNSDAANQLRKLAKDLAGVDRSLRTNLRRNIAAACQPVKTDVQAAYRNLPAETGDSTGLREALANATSITVAPASRTTAVGIRVNANKMPPEQATMPAFVEAGGGRHPVHGHRDRWVEQTFPPVLVPTVTAHYPEISAAVVAACDQAAATFEKGA